MKFENLKYFGEPPIDAAYRRTSEGSPTYTDRMNDCLEGAKACIKKSCFTQALRELDWADEYAGKAGTETPYDARRLRRIANSLYAMQSWDEAGRHLENREYVRAIESLDAVETAARSGGLYFSEEIRKMRNDVFELWAQHEIGKIKK